MKIILASKSGVRKTILDKHKIENEVIVSNVDEDQIKKQIEQINKDDVKGYEQLVKFTKKIFDKGFTELADVPFDKPLVMKKQLPSLLKLKSKNQFIH